MLKVAPAEYMGGISFQYGMKQGGWAAHKIGLAILDDGHLKALRPKDPELMDGIGNL